MSKNSRIDTCPICGSRELFKRPGQVRDLPGVDILECKNCGLVFLSSFAHIQEHFYENSGMFNGIPDIENWVKETETDDERRYVYLKKLIERKSVLDFGCGNGGFLLKAKNTASTVTGIELDTSLRPYFEKKELRVLSSIEETEGKFDVITLFHVLEHLDKPGEMLSRLKEKLSDGGQLIVEVPSSQDALLQLYQSEPFSNFTYWSCHLFLYSEYNLSLLAGQAGLKVNYVKQIQRYPLSNHLYWLAAGKPNGHREWSFLDSPELQSAYEKQLASIGKCDTILASFGKAR